MMTQDIFWKIIDDAKAEAGSDQGAMLKCTDSQLSQLPSCEIVEWFNIRNLYLGLADRKDLEHAASGCGIYLSDDSFLYFRGWLLSQGKDVFYSVLNDPEILSQHITSPRDVYFESFVYAGNDAYTKKAFEEEYGATGMKQWKKDWFAKNPDKSEFSFEMALENKYNIWNASTHQPLSESFKDEIRSDLFSQSENKEMKIEKTYENMKDVEKALLDKFPSESKEYRKLSISLNSDYEWGFGMLPAASQRFHEEMKELFVSAGWEYHEPEFTSSCPEYTKGKSCLYCHPMEISGPCETSLIPEVCRLVANATNCTVAKAEDKGRVYDITDEQYNAALDELRPEIEQDLLRAFSLPDKGSDSDRHESVMMKYRIMTLKNHTNMLSSAHPYWKYTEDVLKDLISQGKIIKRAESTIISSWNYITAPAYQAKDKPCLDSQIHSASSRVAETRSMLDPKTKSQDPEL